MQKTNLSQIMEAVSEGDRRSLAKAITLLESLNTSSDERDYIIDQIIDAPRSAHFIGFSGPPGVGKSSLIQTYVKFLLKRGEKIAVLAVDPSSPVGGGSILGDKTRMSEISAHEDVFVRPSPSLGYLGGLTAQSYLTQLLCAAAGYRYVLVETVGVGQSEVEASKIVDVFIALNLPNAGDELQGIKKGILEVADIIAINKADGDQLRAAEKAKLAFESSYNLSSFESDMHKKFLTLSATQNRNIDELHSAIDSFYRGRHEFINQKRQKQRKSWFQKELESRMLAMLKSRSDYRQFLAKDFASLRTEGESINDYTRRWGQKILR